MIPEQQTTLQAPSSKLQAPSSKLPDPRLPALPVALDAAAVAPRLAHALAESADARLVELHDIRLTRHKAGRRCLIEYDVTLTRGGRRESVTMIGKMRAKGADRATHDLHLALRAAGFCEANQAGVAVPEPLGLLPELGMWLQRKVPGQLATDLLPKADGVALATRIAVTAHTFYGAPVPPQRTHTLADELRILRERLGALADAQPQWRARLTGILQGCERLAATLPVSAPRGIHRDFYPDQVLVNDERLYLIDLDLFCLGDPALDIGNFLGHMREYALRVMHDPQAMAAQEAALRREFCARSGINPVAVTGYTTLTLARHIAISFQFPARRHITPALMTHCEAALT
jgi:hypothetical protein